MAQPDYKFEATNNVRVHADPGRLRSIVSFETRDGKLLDVEADYETTMKIRDEIEKLMGAFWETR